VYSSRSQTRSRKDKLDEGITELRTAIQIEPGRVLAHTNLARVLDRRGKRDEAIIEYRTLLRLKADEHWCRGQLIRLLQRQGKLDEAIAENRTLLRLKPDEDSARGDLVRLLERQGKLDEGLAESRDWLRLHPGSAGAHNSLAWVLVLSPERQPRHYDEGLVHARKAVELAMNGENHFGTLALAEYRSGHWAESLAGSDRSLELGKGGGASEWFFQSVARWQKGDKDEARKWLNKAVGWTKKNDPMNAELLAFWREAALLLGQPGPSAAAPPLADLPADVFVRPEAAR
jgi:tetratricopeptide (TPR) repeat protein